MSWIHLVRKTNLTRLKLCHHRLDRVDSVVTLAVLLGFVAGHVFIYDRYRFSYSNLMTTGWTVWRWTRRWKIRCSIPCSNSLARLPPRLLRQSSLCNEANQISSSPPLQARKFHCCSVALLLAVLIACLIHFRKSDHLLNVKVTGKCSADIS